MLDLQAHGVTALVNEVYLRLIDVRPVQWPDGEHFFAMAAREKLVDPRAFTRQSPAA